MKFTISRASAHKEEDKPCDVAREEYHSYPTSPNMVRECEPLQFWVIELDTLEDLMEFITTNGTMIVDTGNSNIIGIDGSIMIYDSYVE